MIVPPVSLTVRRIDTADNSAAVTNPFSDQPSARPLRSVPTIIDERSRPAFGDRPPHRLYDRPADRNAESVRFAYCPATRAATIGGRPVTRLIAVLSPSSQTAL